ncbi:MAG: uroporphyrinogen decarboxylase family protein [Armatimonadota bacterium]
MTSRERVIKTLNFEPVDRAPRQLWALPGIPMYRNDELLEVLAEFPGDFGGPAVRYGTSKRAKGTPNVVGESTDAWGSVWHVAEPGVVGEVKNPPLEDWSALATYTPPFELLDEADFSQVNESCANSDLFIIAGTETRPFERLQFLRGSENIFMDLAYGTKEVETLIKMIHDFSCREMEMWANTDVDAVSFMDDWGSQTSLLISPAMWREIIKPLYKDYCDILHAKGKYVFFHSDGFIESIYPDLIEIGVNALNSQLFCMDIEGLGEKYRGKITFWGEIDRQYILPLGSTDEVRAAVRRVRKALDHGNGGVIAECEWGIGAPKENIAAVYDEWNKQY